MKPIIQSPNSSGQGFHPSAALHPLAAIVTAAGYTYSHSTPVSYAGDRWRLLHSFRHPGPGEHSVSLMTEAENLEHRDIWETSVSPASGVHWTGKGQWELAAHLKSKGRRYGLTAAPRPPKPAPFPPAFFDSFAGCIPCKVLRVQDDSRLEGHDLAGRSSSCMLTVKLTATRGAYKKGELIEADALKIIPRSHVRGNRILGGYRWNADPAKCVVVFGRKQSPAPATA